MLINPAFNPFTRSNLLMTACLTLVSGILICFTAYAQTMDAERITLAGKPKERIAVIDLRNKAGVNEGELNYLSNLLRQAAGRLPQSKYSVMTQDNILVLLPPDTNLEDCVGTCAVDTGRRLGAHWVMVGEVVRFGSSLRVSLNLHHSQSGELRGADTIKGDTVESLEGPLQGSAVSLFSLLDPSLKRTAERLKRGFVFEKFKYSPLPELPNETSQSAPKQITMPSSVQASTVKGVDFGSVDVEALVLYDEAVKLDKDQNASPESKVAKWEAVALKLPAVSTQAQARVKAWSKFIAERDRRAELARQQAEKERLAKQAMIQKLKALKSEDEALESRRQAQMAKDWAKLSKLLTLSVVSAEDKQNWVEAFVEAYGAVSGLNPHIDDLEEWTDNIVNFDSLVDEGERELKRRAQRNEEISLKFKALTAIIDFKSGVRFIKIPDGRFQMGSREELEEQPIHTIQVKAFLMSEAEVTVAQYRKCVEAAVCTEPSIDYQTCTWDKSGKENHPINCVDWGQARTFAVWAGGDLPTEAQWEYAARGGKNYKYAGSNDVDEVAWYRSNSGEATHQVKTKKPNSYGLYDMSGNVWEWTLDEWHDSYKGAPSSAEDVWGSAGRCRQKCDRGSSGRVIRGGGWSNGGRYLRVANRNDSYPDFRDDYLGFRIRRTLHEYLDRPYEELWH